MAAAVAFAPQSRVVFSGYASLFGVADLSGDVVAPGAFRVSLQRRGAAGVRMLWQHDPAEPIGRWLSIEEDGKGLRVVGELNREVARARTVRAHPRGRARRPVDRLPRRPRDARRARRTSSRLCRSVGNFAGDLPDAAGRADREQTLHAVAARERRAGHDSGVCGRLR